MASKARLRANAKYDRAHTQTYAIKVNKNTEPEIFEKLENENNRAGYIKGLIRKDIMKSDKKPGQMPR